MLIAPATSPRFVFMLIPHSTSESEVSIAQPLPMTAQVHSGVTSQTRAGRMESPSASDWSLSSSKRYLDIAVAVLVLLVFAIPMLIVALWVRLSSRGPALFVQKRVGR